jgi:hypothetical protein
MHIHDIILTLLASGVAVEWTSDGDGYRALIGDYWIRLDEPVVDESIQPELVEAA